MHRLAAEHVLDANLAHLPGERTPRLQQLEDGRQRAHGDRALAALAHDARAHGPRRGGNGDDDFVRLGLVEYARKVAFGVAAHPQPFDTQAPLGWIVVHIADRHEAELAIAHDLARDQPAALAGAGDQDRALALAPAEGCQRSALVDAARDRAHANQEHEREQREQHYHAVGQPDRHRAQPHVAVEVGPGPCDRHVAVHRPQHVDGNDGQQHDRYHRTDDRLVVALARVAPAALVDAREHEHGHAAHEHPPDGHFAQS